MRQEEVVQSLDDKSPELNESEAIMSTLIVGLKAIQLLFSWSAANILHPSSVFLTSWICWLIELKTDAYAKQHADSAARKSVFEFEILFVKRQLTSTLISWRLASCLKRNPTFSWAALSNEGKEISSFYRHRNLEQIQNYMDGLLALFPLRFHVLGFSHNKDEDEPEWTDIWRCQLFKKSIVELMLAS